MKLSLAWLKDYVALPAELSALDIQRQLTMTTVEVEKVSDFSASLEHVVVGEVLTVAAHPRADRLRLAGCDLGGGKRVDVVCGGINLEVGQKVAVALPGAKVRAHGEGGQVVIKTSDVRGQKSDGMLCSAAELGLDDLFPSLKDGEILDLRGLDCAAGDVFANVIGFDDTVLEIDNKSLTNRPDLWGHYGIARELAAIYDLPLASTPRFSAPTAKGGLKVDIVDAAQCRRYTATRIENLADRPSPLWLQSRLVRVGQRPISLLVDLTNYVMLAVGQPSHAFDARLLHGTIQVRAAKPQEPLELLDGRKLELDPQSLVIADDEGPVALAGIMGGRRASVFPDTRDIILEVAQFESSGIRRTVSRMGLRTESSSRFEKGLDPNLVETALAVCSELVAKLAPEAVVAGHVDAHPRPLACGRVRVAVGRVQRRLGTSLSAVDVRKLLERLGFVVAVDGEVLDLTVPTWRSTGDVAIAEDIVEEVARLYGYDKLQFVPPVVKLKAAVRQPQVQLARRLKEYLAHRCGMQELMSYPWVEDKYLEAAGLRSESALTLAAPPAPDARRLQTSLVPHLLKAAALNLRFLEEFRVFELGRVFLAGERQRVSDDREKLPLQPKRLAAALVGKDVDALFLSAKGVLEEAGRVVQMQPLVLSAEAHPCAWADPAATLVVRTGSVVVGMLGVVSAAAMRQAGVRHSQMVVFELEVDALSPMLSREHRFVSFPEYPRARCDLNVVLDNTVCWQQVQALATDAHVLVRQVDFVDEYRGAQVPAGKKSVTLRLVLGSDDGTLTSAQIDECTKSVASRLAAELGGSLRQ